MCLSGVWCLVQLRTKPPCSMPDLTKKDGRCGIATSRVSQGVCHALLPRFLTLRRRA